MKSYMRSIRFDEELTEYINTLPPGYLPKLINALLMQYFSDEAAKDK